MVLLSSFLCLGYWVTGHGRDLESEIVGDE